MSKCKDCGAELSSDGACDSCAEKHGLAVVEDLVPDMVSVATDMALSAGREALIKVVQAGEVGVETAVAVGEGAVGVVGAVAKGTLEVAGAVVETVVEVAGSALDS